MKIERVSQLLPFSCEQVFDLAADIERYPEFLPGWISARIVQRDADTLQVDQVIGVGPAQVQFRSQAVLHRPERIEVSSSDSLFRHYRLTWLVLPLPAMCCRLRVEAQMELRSRFLQQVVSQVLPASIDSAIAAFEARANGLYLHRDG